MQDSLSQVFHPSMDGLEGHHEGVVNAHDLND
jgi:hypothetical protein